MVHIDECIFGKITIDGKEYTEDVVVYPDHVENNWRRKEGHSLHPEDIAGVIESSPKLLIIGRGHYGRLRLLPETRVAIQGEGIEILNQKTARAAKIFNEESEKDRDVVAALHLTC